LNELRIFLCHASEDKPRVAELYHKLKAAGYHPWLDKEDLLPGQDWRREIEKIIRDRYNIVVVCLSCNSVTKRGVVQQEIKWALDVLDQTPEGTIYLIPARLEPCDVPDRLSQVHWVNLFEPDGFEKLKQALDFELGKRQPLGQPLPAAQARIAQPAVLERRQPFEPEMVLIPAGEFLMGSDPNKDKDAYDDEQPRHRMLLPDYYMAKTPVTNAQYLAFVQATRYGVPEHWKGNKPPKGKEDHPVVYVSWGDAMAYCKWLAHVTSKAYRLPSEAEWEKAARGADGRIYPWGDEWDAKLCNAEESAKHGTTPVGAYPRGACPYGLLDMAGNVHEWTTSLAWAQRPTSGTPQFGYPYDPEDGRENLEAGNYTVRVVRGGSFDRDHSDARCASRFWYNANWIEFNCGFRPAASPISSPSAR
jgi:formylglycine-generating enzyme required for sulfatase activity